MGPLTRIRALCFEAYRGCLLGMQRFRPWDIVRCMKPVAPMQAGIHVVLRTNDASVVVRDRYSVEVWAPASSFERVEWSAEEFRDQEPMLYDWMSQRTEDWLKELFDMSD